MKSVRSNRVSKPVAQVATSMHRIAANGAVVTTTTRTEVTPAVVEFQDILDACEITPDEDCDAPWDNSDGWEHHLESVDDASDNDSDNALIDERGRYGRRQRVVLDDCGLPTAACFHARGASWGVATMLAAEAKRKAIAQLVKWHNQGWEYWAVSCDFLDATASLCGVDDFDYADGDVREQIASEVASQLEQWGYVVNGKPDHKAEYTRNRFDHILRNVDLFNTSPR